MGDNNDGFGTGLFLGVMIGVFVFLFVWGFLGEQVKMYAWEDGSAVICDGNTTVVLRDAETRTWSEPDGLTVNICSLP